MTDYLDFVRSSASPILQILDQLGEAEQNAVEIEGKLSGFDTKEGWKGPNELFLTVRHRP